MNLISFFGLIYRRRLYLLFFVTIAFMIIYYTNSYYLKSEKKLMNSNFMPKIVIWSWETSRTYLGNNDQLEVQCSQFKVIVYQNRSLVNLNEMDAIFLRDISGVHLPKEKSKKQKWVLSVLESSENQNRKDWNRISKYIDWVQTYRLDSDLILPYGYYAQKKSIENVSKGVYRTKIRKVLPVQYFYGGNEKYQFNQRIESPKLKEKQVAWFISNCNARSKRDAFVKELSKYINVDIYGGCGKLKCNKNTKRTCLEMAAKKYNFYLSFENSICRDYITEKAFAPLTEGLLPVVFGGGNYKEVLPPNSFIDALSFKGPKELADYLKIVSRNESLYSSYFKWREEFEVLISSNIYYNCAQSYFCEIGDAILENRESNVNREIAKWFFDRYKCFHWTLNSTLD